MYYSEPVLFEIPVLPRIKKFIAVKLRDDDGNPQPLLISPDSEGAGLMLWSMCQAEKIQLLTGWRRAAKSSGGLTDNSGRIIAPGNMTDSLGLGICEFHKSRSQYLLNYAELVVFSNFVDYIIENEMACFCMAEPDEAPLKRIQQFTALYDFSDEDFDERAMRQAFWRSRTNQANNSGFSGLNFNPKLAAQRHFEPMAWAA